MQPTAGAIKAAQLGLKTVCIDKCLGCENGGLAVRSLKSFSQNYYQGVARLAAHA